MTTAGDTVIGGVSGAPTRLAIGAAGNVLTVVGGAPAWAAIPAFTYDDSSSIDFSGAGTSASHFTGSVKLSATSGNAITTNSDGLWAPTFASSDSTSIDFSGSGTTGSPLTAVSKISASANNSVTINPDGLYSAIPTYTTGSVIFAGTSPGYATQNNSNFFWDNSNFRLGIGTNSPSDALHLSGTIAGNRYIVKVENLSTATGNTVAGFQGYNSAGQCFVISGLGTNYNNIPYYTASGTVFSSVQGGLFLNAAPSNAKITFTTDSGTPASSNERLALSNSGAVFSNMVNVKLSYTGVNGATSITCDGANNTAATAELQVSIAGTQMGFLNSTGSSWTTSGIFNPLQVNLGARSAATGGMNITSPAGPINLVCGGNVTTKVAINVDTNLNVSIGNAALATNATDGFLYIPTCAGVPTGTPTSKSGRVPIIFDTTNSDYYIYNGAWKKATNRANASNVQVTTTSQTTIATLTPATQGNYLVNIYYRVTTGTTTVTLIVTWTDSVGAQSSTPVNVVATAVGSYLVAPIFINATASAISVKATSSVANQLFVSANIQSA